MIGKAFIESQDDKLLEQNGDFVRENDKIRTESNGHVHIQFIDRAVLGQTQK